MLAAPPVKRIIGSLHPRGWYLPLVIALAIGFALRVITMIAAYPAIYFSRDMIRYVRIWPRNLLEDYWMPIGFPLFLRWLHAISDRVAPIIIVHHIGGLIIGLIGYVVARRLAVPRRIAVAASVPAFVSGDLLFIEHAIASETLFTLLLALSLLIATTGIVRRSALILLAASCLIACATLVRSVGLVIPIAVALGIIAASWRTPLIAIRLTAAAVIPAFALVNLYSYIARAQGGYPGLSEMNGWALYSRVAPFADCSRFTPPAGTAMLCESRPESERPGPFFYGWADGSPARAHFTVPGALFSFFSLDPTKNGILREFGLEVIKHQPFDYVRQVSLEAGRYFLPSIDKRERIGPGPEFYDFRAAHRWEAEAWLEGVLSSRYRGTPITRRPAVLELLGKYASVVRLGGLALLFLLGGAFAGMLFARDDTFRGALIMFTATAGALVLLPVFMSTYDYRYCFPAQVPLAWAGVLGTWAAVARFRGHKTAAGQRIEPAV